MTLLIIYLAVAIGISFICSILEAVLLSVTLSYVESISSKQPKGSRKLRKVKKNLDESISSILILNTFAHTMGAAGVGAQATKVFGVQWETLVAVLLTLAILYFSEIIPKTIGATYWRRLAVPSAYLIFWLIKLVYPLVWLSSFITRIFSKNKHHKISRDEIIALASLSHKTGALISQENEYLTNVLSLREIKTKQIITPRVMLHSFSHDTTVNEALQHDKTRQCFVYQDSNDNIVGIVTSRDLFIAALEGHSSDAVNQYIKQVHHVSESLPVQNLLDLFIKRREHLFLVVDQFGQLMGIVTLEDAIETMLGREIVDETDTIEDLQEFAKDKYRSRLKQSKKNGAD